MNIYRIFGLVILFWGVATAAILVGDDTPPIYLAAALGKAQDVRALLDKNPELLNHADGYGLTPLHWAVSNGKRSVVEMLLERHADVNAMDMGGLTPLHSAASHGNLEIAKLLVSCGANINARTKKGSYPYGTSAHSRAGFSWEITWAALDQTGVSDTEGWTPLHLAIAYEQKDMKGDSSLHLVLHEDFAVSCSPNPHYSEAEGKKLAQADLVSRRKIVAQLLACQADPNATNQEGQIPFHMASRRLGPDILTLFLDHQADLQIKDFHGNTPLHCAAVVGNQAAVAFLLSRGAVTEVRNNYGKTPSQLADQWGYDEVINLIASAQTKKEKTRVTSPSRHRQNYKLFGDRVGD